MATHRKMQTNRQNTSRTGTIKIIGSTSFDGVQCTHTYTRTHSIHIGQCSVFVFRIE